MITVPREPPGNLCSAVMDFLKKLIHRCDINILHSAVRYFPSLESQECCEVPGNLSQSEKLHMANGAI